jgi:hypothetical protein
MAQKIAVFTLTAALILLCMNCATPDSGLRLAAWGNIAQDGTIRGSSGNFTVAHTGGTNDYTIDWTDSTIINAANSIVDIQVIGAFNRVGVWTSSGPGNLAVTLFVADTGAGAEAPFNFTVYQW